MPMSYRTTKGMFLPPIVVGVIGSQGIPYNAPELRYFYPTSFYFVKDP